MMPMDRALTRAEAEARISELDKLIGDHERWLGAGYELNVRKKERSRLQRYLATGHESEG